MKFNQLAEGQQFKYQGRVYTRKGPLMAVDEKGNSKLMPRSAVVTPLSGSSPEPVPDLERKITVEQAIESFEAFYTHCLNCLDGIENSIDADQLAEIRQTLEAAKQDYIISL